MTRSLIRLNNTVRTSLGSNCMTNSHDDRRGGARTETDRDSMTEVDNPRTGDNKDEIVITKGYDSITRSYRNRIGSITKSYRRK